MEALKSRVVAAVNCARPAIVGLSRRIHANPEPGYQECRAAAWVAELLAEHGYRVGLPYAGLETALRAEIPDTPDRPTIALLAEYDALPGIGHGCGHNLIAAVAVGAALGLARVASELPGRVVVLGTPAEEGGVEGGGGKVLLLERGAFQGVDAALLLHPSSRTVVASRSNAREALEIVFRGKAAHASQAPELGASALEGLLLTFNALNALRPHLDQRIQIHGIVTHGGTTPGVIPERAAGRFYVRAPTGALLEQVAERVRHSARGAADATGTRVSFRRFSHTYLELRPNPVLAEVMARSFWRCGFYPEEPSPGGSGSTDMGNVSHAVPALHPYFSVGERACPSHTAGFARLAGSPVAQRRLIAAAKALAMTCLDLLSDPGALPRAWQAFSTGNEVSCQGPGRAGTEVGGQGNPTEGGQPWPERGSK